MGTEAAKYLVGVGGWEHEVFDTCLYPQAKLASPQKLSYYAEYFDIVEVRQAFWDSDLNSHDAQEWIAAVAANRSFQFSVKAHASFTHTREVKPGIARNVRGMLAEFSRHNRLAALLAQFPYSYTNTSANRYHLAKLGEIFRGFPVHVEFRHESWNQGSVLELLNENGLRPVSADLPRIKQFMPFGTAAVPDSAYLRLHGRGEKGWLSNGYDARYDYLYNGREIQELRRRCEALSTKCRQVYVICNNTTGGKAIASALQLRAAMQQSRTVNVPASAVRAFPHLAAVAKHRAGGASLFVGPGYREAM
jgi:uncharacterized protein YecE (DUF72 family)